MKTHRTRVVRLLTLFALLLTAAPLWAADPGTWAPLSADMYQARVGHTATLLKDGKVLLAGGKDASGQALATAELFDPAASSYAPLGNLAVAVWGHTATLLSDGTVLISGGTGASVAAMAVPAR